MRPGIPSGRAHSRFRAFPSWTERRGWRSRRLDAELPPPVELRNIRKRFGAVTALDGAALRARPGEVHALLGENGAGKSTLLNILQGLVAADDGDVLLNGRRVHITSPREAVAVGIGMVHQHFTLVPRFTVLENVALGDRPPPRAPGETSPGGGLRHRLLAMVADTGLGVDPDARVEDLGVGARQRVEILKALLRRPAVLALDEPTAVLTPGEVDRLFGILGALARGGRTVLLVAHKLDEVLRLADRVTVLRDGRTVLEAPRGEVDAGILARAMVGRSLPPPSPPVPSDPGSPVARIRDVRLRPAADAGAGLQGVSLELRRGEIVGIAGVEGNGQRELALVLSGRVDPDTGTADLPRRTGFIPQDRRDEGLVLDFDVTGNLALALHDDAEWRRGWALAWGRIRTEAGGLIERYGIRARGPDVPVRTLSGGNQQKVVVGRELDRDPELLVVENPTRGLDVASTAFVHGELRRRRVGRSIVLLSTDLEEVLTLSDRVLVIVRGRLVPVPREERTREGVGLRMLGGDVAP